jgi:1-aminocyclopropane-1-carboxylate deaminase
MHLPISNITLDNLTSDLLSQKEITLSILRLDKIHADVSGNKLFKLHYYVQECLQSEHKTMLTFGGAYSNHLVATAFLCNEKGIKSIGIVRGDEPKNLSHTLQRCRAFGMQLHFISRDQYKITNNDEAYLALINTHGDCTIVPEGGYGNLGAKGASLIMDILKVENPSYICTCVGTATTLAGLVMNKIANEKIIAIPAIKNMTDIFTRIKELTHLNVEDNLIILGDYHFGGYAKYNSELINFMNQFYSEYNIPTDIVYTAKMMYAVMDKIANNYFEKGSNIVCIHTGGLQGNASLPSGTVIF